MMTRRLAALIVLLTLRPAVAAEDIPLEYKVKAAFLFNFTRFVEWPPSALDNSASFAICVAGKDPFGPLLETTVAGESAAGRAMVSRLVKEATASCQVLFIPRDVAAAPYLRQLRGAPVLTVGETSDFLDLGGVVSFVVDTGKVRFDINRDAAARSGLTISSRLLRLARRVDPQGGA